MKPTDSQLEMIQEASKKPIVYEDDCPELTPQMIEAFKKAAAQRNMKLKKAGKKTPELLIPDPVFHQAPLTSTLNFWQRVESANRNRSDISTFFGVYCSVRDAMISTATTIGINLINLFKITIYYRFRGLTCKS